jgi:hypothetical protein
MRSRLSLNLPVLAVATLSLAACSADIMRGYMGRSPEAVMAKYGPPVDVRDLPDGRRAYQWLEVETTTQQGEAITRAEGGRHGGRPKIRTEYAPSTTHEQRCFYTFYAHRTPDGWRFDDFAKPALGC